jgi:PST family polysaccharide transporter
MARYLPGLAFATLCDRVAFVPERILIRDLRFGTVSVMRTVGDLSHTGISVALAVAGWGAAAIVMGNVARAVLRLAICIVAVERRDWLAPCRYSVAKMREILAFGVPIAVGSLCAFAARRWDNLLVSRFFGASTAGMYNLAYNLADVPAIQVGEQMGDVLLPSFARLPADRRPAALVRSLGLLGLVVFPLAVGLGAVAPTLVAAVFNERWQPVAPMLLLLSALSVTRPVAWTISSYLQARQFPRWLMWLELGKLALLVVALASFGRRDPLWACTAVGLAYGAHTLASLWVVRRTDGVPLRRSLAAVAPALLACVPMVVAVLAVRRVLVAVGVGMPFASLAFEVLAGAAGYLVAVMIVARSPSRDLLARLREALRREVKSA